MITDHLGKRGRRTHRFSNIFRAATLRRTIPFAHIRRNLAEGSLSAAGVVTTSAVSGRTVTMNYATVDGTAVSGSDYVAASGTLTFAAGVTTQTMMTRARRMRRITGPAPAGSATP